MEYKLPIYLKGEKMKKILLLGMAIFILTGPGFLFADRNAIDDFLKSYEVMVEEAETLAKNAAVSAMEMLPFSQKALDFSMKAEVVQKDTDWSMQDLLKLTDLSMRYAAAAEIIQSKLK